MAGSPRFGLACLTRCQTVDGGPAYLGDTDLLALICTTHHTTKNAMGTHDYQEKIEEKKRQGLQSNKTDTDMHK